MTRRKLSIARNRRISASQPASPTAPPTPPLPSYAPSPVAPPLAPGAPADSSSPEALTEKTVRLLFGDTGHSYESLFGPYLSGARTLTLVEPYVRTTHQLGNLVRFSALLARVGDCRQLVLLTGQPETEEQQAEDKKALEDLKWSLKEFEIQFNFSFSATSHDREMRLSNGWIIRSGRGLDFYQKPESWFSVGVNDFAYRPCLETTVVFQRSNALSRRNRPA